jgi:G3E family GTPase
VLRADHGRIEPQTLLRAGLPDEQTTLAGRASPIEVGEQHAGHGRDIQTYAILRDRPIRAVTLALFLETLAEHCGSDLLRLKGIVKLMESPDRPAVIHGVQHVFHAPSFLERWPSDDRRSRIVIIARHIPQQWVELLLEAIEEEVSEVARL